MPSVSVTDFHGWSLADVGRPFSVRAARSVLGGQPAGGPPRSAQAHFLTFYKVKLYILRAVLSTNQTTSVDQFSQPKLTRSLDMFSGAQQAPSPAQIALAQAEARRTMKGFVYTILTIRAIPFVFDYIGSWL
ncbi:hypothetical protein MJO28_003885 [Puccinia striiformis f. sp. tritici]|uniref:Uncharacterized protein n=1 Tax=Puccinia striiformis f. sp. tritici TaxID=168172 RepID=A0ACC0EMV4_9BASI|nr:hypothetical protein Pst134EA_007491 [Puccinia striiformis f. sp. tritici]KAH9470225.1 hypothetical protein Pst134EA_007491 [Puccinia striiformis f. sp. tritici]KAI7956790.1 hypothetical protein MJO28_003885 [Puccinia striiformis f. sp. tritici]KAI9626848.1 hypothetical protein KEM48_010136 [Puccinia striiformis f. sp. tritici PST-130]